jgi:phosphoglucosamine mutase
VGIALDGDADRVVMVDERGEIVDGDKLMGVLAVHLQSQGALKGEGMVATVMSNEGLGEYLSAHGLTLHRSAVGDKNVVAMMQERGINFGGEQSGHVIFSDYAKTGDGVSSALQALAYLVSTGQKASEAFNPYDSYPQLLVNLPISRKPEIDTITGIEALKNEVEEAGMRHLFRYSGTENLIRILLEGKDAQKLDNMMKKCKTFFQSELS